MKYFVSGSIADKSRIQDIYRKIKDAGHSIVHDWTLTDDMDDKLKSRDEAGERIEKDIDGVLEADIYVIDTDNERPGKAMYAELGAALASYKLVGKPIVYTIGPLNHLSVAYLHPDVTHKDTIEEILNS